MGAIFAGTAAAAEPVALTNQAIKDTVTGSVMHLDTPVGTKLPVRYADDGLISGEAGDLASYLGAASDRGRWWVEKNRLCHKWFKWFDAEVQCLQLRQDGQRIFWTRDDGKTGTATIAMRPAPISVPAYAPAYAMGLAALKREQIAPENTAAVAPADPPKPARTNQPLDEKPIASVQPQSPQPKKDKPAAASQSLPKPAALAATPRADQVKPTRTTRPAEAKPAAKSPLFMVANVEEDDVLNIRSGPSAEHDPIGAIPARAQGVQMSGVCQMEWCPVVYRGISGWVNSFYLVGEVPFQGSAWLGMSAGRDRRLPE